MTDRIYAVVEDVQDAEAAVSSLKSAGIHADALGVMCKNENVAESNLPEADLTHTSEVLESAGRGAVIGGVTGLLAGLTAVAFPPAGLALGGTAVAGITAAGTGIGAWSASMIGISEQSGALREVNEAVEAGKVLVIANSHDGSEVDSLESALQSLRGDMGTKLIHSGIAKD